MMKEKVMKWLKRKWNQFKNKGWKYALAIGIGYLLHLSIEGLVVNYIYYSFLKPTYIAIV